MENSSSVFLGMRSQSQITNRRLACGYSAAERGGKEDGGRGGWEE